MDTMLTVLLGTDEVFSRRVLFDTTADLVKENLPPECGEAVRALSARELADLPLEGEGILVIAAPSPELREADYRHLLAAHLAVGSDVTLLLSGETEGDGVVVRDADNEIITIGRGKGARALQMAVFRPEKLREALAVPSEDFYHLVNAAAACGAYISATDASEVIEVVDPVTAYVAQERLQARTNLALMTSGVQIFAPDTTYVAPDSVIEPGAVILPGCLIRRGCRVGAGAVIGPNTILERASIGARTTVNSSQVYESEIGADATVGPFAYVRPGCRVGDHTRIGDFVELKKAEIGDGTKVSHLTYIGDATVGERVNFGCGTVVVNYDGYVKSQTVIGDDCFIGCNTNLVAPVLLGDRVFTAAGTTVTKDVPAGALAVARSRQTVYEGWNDKRRAAHAKK